MYLKLFDMIRAYPCCVAVNCLILISFIAQSNSFYLTRNFNSLIRQAAVVTRGQSNYFPLHSSTSSNNDDLKSLFNEQVEYIDLSASTNIESSDPLVTRSLPLFLLSGAFYPQGTTELNVFEMRYRTMMFDVANSDDMFGYIHTNPQTGQIAAIGTLCKIVERTLLEDGRQRIELDGIQRFRVKKILKTLPYVVAEVETDVTDEIVSNENDAIELEKDVYSSLKYYMRILKTYDQNRNVVVSQSTKRNRPTTNKRNNIDDSYRRSDFSFAIANMIQMSHSAESQLMLQTVNVMKRLRVEKEVLNQAAEVISSQLIKMNFLTLDKKEEIKRLSFNDSFDDDILPPDEIAQKKDVEKDEWDLQNIE
eukprot:gene11140-14949_t